MAVRPSSLRSESDMTNVEKIRDLVDKAKDYPNAIIEYSFELPQARGITPTEFYGVKAVFNKDVPKSVGANIIYRY